MLAARRTGDSRWQAASGGLQRAVELRRIGPKPNEHLGDGVHELHLAGAGGGGEGEGPHPSQPPEPPDRSMLFRACDTLATIGINARAERYVPRLS